MSVPANGEIYFQFAVSGNYVRVTAIEASSGLEATILGARNTAQSELERLALAKLEFERGKKKPAETPRPPSKGLLA